MGIRYFSRIYLPNKRAKTLCFMDHLNPVRMEPIYGVPLGGIGCGTIGRGFRGEFCRSSLSPGLYCHRIHPADQFILTVRRGNHVYQRVLASRKPPMKSGSSLHHWEWGFPGKHGHYVGLYPRSWTAYELPEFGLLLICEQISPVIPGNYKDSCLPVGVFHWTIYNFNKSDHLEVSITMTWRGPRYPSRPDPSDCGLAGAQCSLVASSLGPKDEATAPFSQQSEHRLRGCLMETLIGGDMPCTYGLAAAETHEVSVTRCTGFQFKTCNGSHPSHLVSSSSRSSKHSPTNSEPGGQRPLSEAPSASEFWSSLKESGHLTDDSTGFYLAKAWKHSPKLGMAVCAKCVIPPASDSRQLHPGHRNVDFFLVWHMPRVHFRSALVAYTRRYVRWFSESPSQGARELLMYAASHWRTWQKKIEEWQAPILADLGLPDWYKSALFNELYYLSDGGTVWLDPLPEAESFPSKPSSPSSPPIDFVRCRNPSVVLDPLDLSGRKKTTRRHSQDNEEDRSMASAFQARTKLGNEMGLFAYLEGHEYRMYNTYDVHFNASWALIMLWPKIQLAMNYDLADMTLSEDSTEVTFLYKNIRNICNNRLCVPHDCGDPEREPWYHVNAYIMFPTDRWKDLNPKFILMAWRDWKLTGDKNYLLYMVPIVVAVVRCSLEKWDKDNDGIIECEGFPDQTYDAWKTNGLGAYVGGLWIAALYGVHEMMQAASHLTPNPARGANHWEETNDNLKALLKRAATAYHESLWGGEFYRYDSYSSLSNTPILADQLSGHWYLRLTGAPADAILPKEAILLCLRTIMNLNWKNVHGGRMGAINGVLPNGKCDNSNIQAAEFWVAINYGLGSLLLLEGMRKEGFELAGACFEHVYNQMGLHFQTPEAFTRDTTFRSLGYMRPLAIWSIQQALKLTTS
ncbi:hypothetical protein AAHC03_0261 [Spirometra sp. Aus1]